MEEPQDLGEPLMMDANQLRISPDGKYIFFVANNGFSYCLDSLIRERLQLVKNAYIQS